MKPVQVGVINYYGGVPVAEEVSAIPVTEGSTAGVLCACNQVLLADEDTTREHCLRQQDIAEGPWKDS